MSNALYDLNFYRSVKRDNQTWMYVVFNHTRLELGSNGF